MQQLILASSSPRRQELLTLLQIPFTSIPADVDETPPEGVTFGEIVEQLALRKAIAVQKQLTTEQMIIGADTLVIHQGDILGKPIDQAAARAMLNKLSGSKHDVYTGVAIVQGQKQVIFSEKTVVTFWDLADAEIERYLATGEPFDKAGGYGIQGFGSLLVKQISGDYYNVVGLPISRLSREVRHFYTKE